MGAANSHEEIIERFAVGTTPDAVIAFRPSESVQKRVADLVEHFQGQQHLD
jgi:hypothetical protein